MHKLLTEKLDQEMMVLGNEAIARGAIEEGVAVATTYTGTPSSEIALNFFQIARDTDLYFEYSVNEKTALEVAAAAANCGLRSMCTMKHVGVNVAADALITLAYIGVKGGLVVVSADRPVSVVQHGIETHGQCKWWSGRNLALTPEPLHKWLASSS